MKEVAAEIFSASLKAVDPYEAVKLQAGDILSAFEKGGFRQIIVAGFGKAACPMAQAVEDSLGDLVRKGVAITKYDHCANYKLRKIQVYEAGHPVPDENGLKGTADLIRLLSESDEKSLVLCLISGGGSALLVAPYEGISLDEKQKTTQMLLKSGADIFELNTIRKHVSRVKGGRLAEIISPASAISLILSDVIGDRLDVIASGPTAPDLTTYRDALEIINRYHLADSLPRRVYELISRGAESLVPDTPKENNPIFKRIRNEIVGSNIKAIESARQRAGELGFETRILFTGLTGEAREAAKLLYAHSQDVLKKVRSGHAVRTCLISGGETTVTVRGNGLGGRNMEMALAFALEVVGTDGITFLSAGTDGTDGPTDAAGAFADGKTITQARAAGLNPESFLSNNDSYNFFKKAGGLFITGPTGTNVMDVQIVLIE